MKELQEKTPIQQSPEVSQSAQPGERIVTDLLNGSGTVSSLRLGNFHGATTAKPILNGHVSADGEHVRDSISNWLRWSLASLCKEGRICKTSK